MYRSFHLSAFSTDTAGQLNVLGHDGDTLGVDGAQVGVLKQADQVSFRSLLESQDS
jgi:hypothetical protein